MSSRPSSSTTPKSGVVIASALGVLAMFRIVGLVYQRNFALDLGSLLYPAPFYSAFLVSYVVFGSVSLGLLTWGITRIARRDGMAKQFESDWTRSPDSRFMTVAAVGGAAAALMVRVLILRGARLTDDEAAYQFMAELLSTGRVSAPSHAVRAFFDNAFMINDGRFYAKYFLGWPLLLAPVAALGAPGLVNPALFGLTLPPVFLVLRHHLGSAWARAGAILMVTAPMLLVGSATLLSHTACMCALAWAWYALLRCERASSAGPHIALAVALASACLIRPIAGLGLGLPLGLHWLGSLRQGEPRQRVWAALGFGAVAAVALAIFLGINHAQTGDAFTLAYERASAFVPKGGEEFRGLPESYHHMQFADPLRALATAGICFLRLNFALFGWPIGLVVALLAAGMPEARLAWAAAIGFVAVHLPITDPGIDSFGPVHYYEIALPVLLLCTMGFARIGRLLAAHAVPSGQVFAPALLSALVVVAWLGYVPVRVSALTAMTDDILAPDAAIEQANIHNAVVFAPRPWGASCLGRPSKSFVFFRPNNDPELRNDILWVNNLGLARDRELMRSFPNRTGYLLVRFADCRMKAFRLDEVNEELAEPQLRARLPHPR